MNKAKKELIENFLKKANILINIGNSPAIEIAYKKGEIVIDVKNPMLLMELGIDFDFLKKSDKKESVIRKCLKELGFRIKLRYKFFQVEL